MELLAALGYGVSYALTGIALLVAGFFLFDVVTPHSLGERIWVGRSLNAAMIVSAMFLGIGAVQFTVMWTNAHGSLGADWLWTLAFGVLGLVLQVLGFLVLDWCTPGSLREIAVEDGFHPGALVAAAGMLATSAIICAALA